MISFNEERLAAALPDLTSLISDTWNETRVDADALPLNPDWPSYAALDRIGALLLIVARERGRAIGFAACAIHRNINSAGVTEGTIATWHMRSCHSRGLRVRALLAAGKTALVKRGATRITIKALERAEPILKNLGFAATSIEYSMVVRPTTYGAGNA